MSKRLPTNTHLPPTAFRTVKFARDWPEEAPILEGKDMVRYRYNSDDGKKSCLMGHVRNTFKYRFRYQVEKSIMDVISEVRFATSIVAFNDDYSTKELAARVWNKAMANLGYTVNNPEA